MVRKTADGNIVIDVKTFVGIVAAALSLGAGGTGVAMSSTTTNTVQQLDVRLIEHTRRLNAIDEYHAKMDERWLIVIGQNAEIAARLTNLENRLTNLEKRLDR